MHITVQEPANEQLEFNSEYDIFGREKFGEQLKNLIVNTSGPAVFALDSAWGTGKSSFIKMWINSIKAENKHDVIYFDAFQNDFQKDPLIAIASEIYTRIDASDKDEYREKLGHVIWAMLRGSLDIALKVKSGGAVGFDEIENLFTSDAETTRKYDEYLMMKLDAAHKDKEAIEQFKAFLQNAKSGRSASTIFIIDELDRCRPDFALEVLERIKHLFCVKNIKFLLVTNRKQLHEIIKIKYGSGVDASNYLHKFVSVWVDLPAVETKYHSHKEKFIDYALHSIADTGEGVNLDELADYIKTISKTCDLSYREIERLLSSIAICYNISKNTKNFVISNAHILATMVIVCCLKLKTEKAFELVKANAFEEIREILRLPKPAEANNIPDIIRKTDFITYANIMSTYLSYEMENGTERRNELKTNLQTGFGVYVSPNNLIPKIINFLSITEI